MTEYFNIALKPETADELYELKEVGESWDDVVRRELLDDEPAGGGDS